ncbi:MAG: hypothetical protein PVH74_13420 [Desulfobacterales bacterium]|nr:hypothetical protein [Deltaproteobacteria bacterium]MBW2443164.1 hypothetical protein [Deltaproteobacteria bacterium]
MPAAESGMATICNHRPVKAIPADFTEMQIQSIDIFMFYGSITAGRSP